MGLSSGLYGATGTTRNFVSAIVLAVMGHVGLLLASRMMFPFRTVITIIPLALFEFTVLFTLVLALCGYARY